MKAAVFILSTALLFAPSLGVADPLDGIDALIIKTTVDLLNIPEDKVAKSQSPQGGSGKLQKQSHSRAPGHQTKSLPHLPYKGQYIRAGNAPYYFYVGVPTGWKTKAIQNGIFLQGPESNNRLVVYMSENTDRLTPYASAVTLMNMIGLDSMENRGMHGCYELTSTKNDDQVYMCTTEKRIIGYISSRSRAPIVDNVMKSIRQ